MLPRPRLRLRDAFTLVELLVSMAVLTVLALLFAQMAQSTSRIWKSTSEESDSFESARTVFQTLTSQLTQATTRTYSDYFNAAGQTEGQFKTATPAGTFVPVAFGRQSELHFICGPDLLKTDALPPYGQYTHAIFFQCPLRYSDVANYANLNGLLNSSGFFIEFGKGDNVANSPPAFLNTLPTHRPRYRFRLMTFAQQTENFTVYQYPGAPTDVATETSWFALPLAQTHATYARAVADNIVALIIWPKSSTAANDMLSPDYKYDSRNQGKPWQPGGGPQPLAMNQMPPILNVAMVALDESSAIQIQGSATTPPTAVTAALTGLFADSSKMEADLVQFEAALVAAHLKFRVFSATLAISSAKFSTR